MLYEHCKSSNLDDMLQCAGRRLLYTWRFDDFRIISGRDVYPLCQVEERYWYCSPGKYVIDPKEAVDLVDEVSISHIYNRPAL